MNLLHPTIGGRHFAGGFKKSAIAVHDGIEDFCKTELAANSSPMKEGTVRFEKYQASVLRDAERSLFAASSLFSRALRSCGRTHSPWLHVTLYYSSFLSAKAAAGALGGWYDSRAWDVVCDTEKPGSQLFRPVKIKPNRKGTHRAFWNEFYSAVAPLKPWAKASRGIALTPVNGLAEWLIEQRNECNYRMSKWWAHMADFGTAFDEKRFPNSLPKELGQQFEVAKEMLGFAFDVATAVDLKTDVFAPGADRSAVIRQDVFNGQVADLRVYEAAIETELLGKAP